MRPTPPAGIPDPSGRDPVERAKSHPAAFGELYDRHFSRIYRFVRARSHDDGLAEDVTADVFMSALRSIKSYQDQGRPFSCWLYRIAANAVASHYRNRRLQLSLDDAIDFAAPQPDPADEVADRQRGRAIVDAW